MGRPRILAAVSPPSLPLLAELLTSYELVPVFALREAIAGVRGGGIDAIVVCLHFDSSRMPVLLEALKRDPAMREIPVVCCRLRPTMLPRATVRAARVVSDALGAEAFIDVYALLNWAGKAAAAARLRSVVERARAAA